MNQSAEKAARDTARRASRREGWGWARGGMRVEESLAGGGHRGQGVKAGRGLITPPRPRLLPRSSPLFRWEGSSPEAAPRPPGPVNIHQQNHQAATQGSTESLRTAAGPGAGGDCPCPTTAGGTSGTPELAGTCAVMGRRGWQAWEAPSDVPMSRRE